jgi:hypothetical protein
MYYILGTPPNLTGCALWLVFVASCIRCQLHRVPLSEELYVFSIVCGLNVLFTVSHTVILILDVKYTRCPQFVIISDHGWGQHCMLLLHQNMYVLVRHVSLLLGHWSKTYSNCCIHLSHYIWQIQ